MTPSSLSPEIAAQLDALKDIRVPPPVSWWPLAPGWWVLAITVALLLVFLFGREAIRRRTAKYAALRELAALRKRDLSTRPTNEIGAQISALLRRVTLCLPGGDRYASAHDNDWIHFLEEAPGGIPHDIARFVATAPYAPETKGPSMQTVFDAAETWIRRRA